MYFVLLATIYRHLGRSNQPTMGPAPPFEMPGYTWDSEKQRFFKNPQQKARVQPSAPSKHKRPSPPPAPPVRPSAFGAETLGFASALLRLRQGMSTHPEALQAQWDKMWVNKLRLARVAHPRLQAFVKDNEELFAVPSEQVSIDRILVRFNSIFFGPPKWRTDV